MNRAAAFLGKWSPRSLYVVMTLLVMGDILRDAMLFGTTSSHDVWPSAPQIMWTIVLTSSFLGGFWMTSTHRARRVIIVLLGLDMMVDAILLGLHVETVYNEWTLIRDCLWLWAIFVLAVGSPPKHEAKTLTYPSIERIP